MNEILNLQINEMAQTKFDCTCGRNHFFSIHDMAIGKGTLNELASMAKPFIDGKVLMVCDNNTYKAAGEQALKLMETSGFQVKLLVFDKGTDILIPDESVVGRVLQELELNITLMVAVGSGTLNDLVKFVSSRTKVPYIVVCTAPSMDGYVADGAPLICDGKKISYPACLAYGVVGDTDIMKKAPSHLIHAGFGDVVGKLTALADWDLAVHTIDEYRCDTCVTLVNRALEKCFSKTDDLAKGDEEAVLYLIEALTLTGVAMGLVGVSRPASGSEHMLSHYWEMDFIAKGRYPELHGIKVGVATPVIAEFFEELSDCIPKTTAQAAPSRLQVEDLLRRAGCPVSPKDIGVDKDLFYRSLMEGYQVRPRYSILRFAKEKGRLKDIAEKITERIYGGRK